MTEVDATIAARRARQRKNSQLKARHRQKILKQSPKNGVCVEIGVWKGEFSQVLLDALLPKHLYLIDPWQYFPSEEQESAFAGQTKSAEFDAIHQSVAAKYQREIDAGQVRILRQKSVPALLTFDDKSIDFAYVDGDHSYEGIKSDLIALYPKMRSGGRMVFDDYHRRGWWKDDVLRAIHEFIGAHPTGVRVHAVEGAQISIGIF